MTQALQNHYSIPDASLLQEDLTNVEVGYCNVNLELNPEKCKILRITRKQQKIEHPYKLHNTALETIDFERDLGVWTLSNLTWTKHVEYQCT